MDKRTAWDARQRAAGLRKITAWVPDKRAQEILDECRKIREDWLREQEARQSR